MLGELSRSSVDKGEGRAAEYPLKGAEVEFTARFTEFSSGLVLFQGFEQQPNSSISAWSAQGPTCSRGCQENLLLAGSRSTQVTQCSLVQE